MPETTINLNDGLMARKHHVGLAGEIFDVQTVSESSCVQRLSDQKFGLCILASHSRHHLAALFWTNAISQSKHLNAQADYA